MDDALAALVIGVGEEHVPALGQHAGVHSKAVILGGDVAAACAFVDARLVVPTVPIPAHKHTHTHNQKSLVTVRGPQITDLLINLTLLNRIHHFPYCGYIVTIPDYHPHGQSHLVRGVLKRPLMVTDRVNPLTSQLCTQECQRDEENSGISGATLSER